MLKDVDGVLKKHLLSSSMSSSSSSITISWLAFLTVPYALAYLGIDQNMIASLPRKEIRDCADVVTDVGRLANAETWARHF